MSRKKWQVLKSKYALKTPFMKVRLDTCKTNKGHKVDYYVIEKSDSVGIVAITPDKKIILQRQYRYPIKKWIYQIPAGHLDKGENTRQAINRELLEESGYQAKKLIKLNSVYSGISKHHSKTSIYLGLKCQNVNQINPDKAEDIETYLVDFDQAIEMVHNGKIEDVDSAYAILAAARYIDNHSYLLWTRKLVPTFRKRRIVEKTDSRFKPTKVRLLNRYIFPV